MSIREAEETLFDEWSRDRKWFTRDGVICESQYLKASPRILFILKEPNDKKKTFKDLRAFLQEGGRSQTWDSIARWIKGIYWGMGLSWNDLAVDNMGHDERNNFRIEQLQKVVAMNLKKEPGVEVTDNKELTRHALADGDFLKRQIALYEPELIICCGPMVGHLASEIFWPDRTKDWKETSWGVEYLQVTNRQVAISYHHPAARAAPNALCQTLMGAVREVLKNKKN